MFLKNWISSHCLLKIHVLLSPIFQKRDVDFEYVIGERRNARLVYVLEENNLFVTQAKRNGKEEYICYQKFLSKTGNKKTSKKSKKRRNGKNSSNPCTARIVIDANGKCYRNKVPHSAHDNHEFIYKDMVTKNRIISRSLAIKDALDGIPLEVPTHDVFTHELAK